MIFKTRWNNHYLGLAVQYFQVAAVSLVPEATSQRKSWRKLINSVFRHGVVTLCQKNIWNNWWYIKRIRNNFWTATSHFCSNLQPMQKAFFQCSHLLLFCCSSKSKCILSCIVNLGFTYRQGLLLLDYIYGEASDRLIYSIRTFGRYILLTVLLKYINLCSLNKLTCAPHSYSSCFVSLYQVIN